MGPTLYFIIGFRKGSNVWEIASIVTEDRSSLDQLFRSLSDSASPYENVKICETIYG
jgi:hypothetical protein